VTDDSLTYAAFPLTLPLTLTFATAMRLLCFVCMPLICLRNKLPRNPIRETIDSDHALVQMARPLTASAVLPRTVACAVCCVLCLRRKMAFLADIASLYKSYDDADSGGGGGGGGGRRRRGSDSAVGADGGVSALVLSLAKKKRNATVVIDADLADVLQNASRAAAKSEEEYAADVRTADQRVCMHATTHLTHSAVALASQC
jgi:hypothetical protein